MLSRAETMHLCKFPSKKTTTLFPIIKTLHNSETCKEIKKSVKILKFNAIL